MAKDAITLKSMCAKWWLERVQHHVRKGTSKLNLFALQRFLSDLPRELRSYILHNGLKAGGLHLSHSSKEIPAVNRSLVFLSSDVVVNETVYVTFRKYSTDDGEYNPDVELLVRHGEGISKICVSMPCVFNNVIKTDFTDVFRTCHNMTEVTINEANDDMLTLVTRYCRNLRRLDASESLMVTDEGVARIIVNLKWSENKGSKIKFIDLGMTSVTRDGEMQLVSRLPSITSFGGMDILEAIEGVVVLTDSSSFKTAVEEITVKCATVGRIQSLKKYCPDLNSIRITYQEQIGATINDLRLLKNLNHIEIMIRDPYMLSLTNFNDFIWHVGMNLFTLKLWGDIYWEADLGIIAAQCPHLRNLSLPAITILGKDSLTILQADHHTSLANLRELEIDCMKGICPKAWAKDFSLVRYGIVLALKRCTSLRKLVLRPTCLIDTDFIDVFSQTSLAKLEVLELYNSTLGLACAKAIVDSCINLHVMKGLRTWRGITLHELMLLRRHTRGHKRASDLKIIP